MSMHQGRIGLALAVTILLSWQTVAQSTYSTNFDTLTVGSSILTASSGSGQWVDATGSSTAQVANSAGVYQSITLTNYVIFQGDISNLFSRIQPDSSGQVLAQLLAQVIWCDGGMPDNSLCPGRQGGVCVSNGYAYAWSTNGWLQLTNRLDARQTIASNTWTKFTFSASYLDAVNSSVYYKVYVDGTNFVPTTTTERYVYAGTAFAQDPTGSYIRSSATFTTSPSTKGISGFYIAGSGAIDVPSVSTSSAFVPMSSGIDIRAYQGSDSNGTVGIFVEFTSKDEEGNGTFTVLVKDASGRVIWSGSVPAIGSNSNRYRLLASGLSASGVYTIQVVDEVNNRWQAQNVSVGTFAAAMVKMSPMGLSIQFSTIPDRDYDIQWTPKLGGEWVTAVTNLHALSSSTNVFVFFPDPAASSGFFRILMH